VSWVGRFKLWASIFLILAVCAAGVWGWWNFELRWRPKTVTRHQAEISALLQASGWVSSGGKGAKLYVLAPHACPGCERLRADLLPVLRDHEVDTRVIALAPADANGQAQSTAAERSTVAQLWIARDRTLLDRWEKAPAANWTAPGVPPADGDMGRTAVVESGRQVAQRLAPLLADNGVKFAYPVLVWWNTKGEMRACACQAPQTWRFVRREVGG
jgi:hypothetical protein